MSAHIPCECEGTRKERIKNWYVLEYKVNHSYFESPKGQAHISDYSTVCCRNCSMNIRTKAKYVESLPSK